MNNICVFDLETDAIDTDICNPTQVGCQMINPYNLEVINGSQFYSKIRPDNMDNDDYLSPERKKTIDFHCRNRNVSKAELMKEWSESPPLSVVWKQFAEHIDKYNKTGRVGDAPIAAGINIINFDLKIVSRLNTKFNIKKMFGYEIIDLRHIVNLWLMWDSQLKSKSMDSLRDYFGMSHENAHDALQDVKDETQILQKFLTLHKGLFPKILFKDCFKEEYA